MEKVAILNQKFMKLIKDYRVKILEIRSREEGSQINLPKQHLYADQEFASILVEAAIEALFTSE